MTIRRIVNSIFNSVCYRIGNFIIDPGDKWEGFSNVKAVLLTHAHFDHIYGLNDVMKVNPTAKVYTTSLGREMLLNAKKNLSAYHEMPFVFDYPDAIIEVEDGQQIRCGEVLAKAVFTPGHNPSCITWVVGDCVFSGDSLIPGIKTVTNLPKFDKTAAAASEELIRNLMSDRHLFPGHSV